MQKIVLATNNVGKVKEFREMFAPLNVEIIPQSELDVSEIEETGLTFMENALLKARHASQQTELPAIADDSGLLVDALQGAPGLYSARYAGIKVSAETHIKKLLQALHNVPEDRRTGHYYCALVYLVNAKDPEPIFAEGKWYGKILTAPQGSGGFGYDPIFFDPIHNCSAAEFSSEEKHRLSHRGQAMQELLQKLATIR